MKTNHPIVTIKRINSVAKIEVDEGRMIDVPNFTSTSKDGKCLMQTRSSGEFRFKSYYLGRELDWVIGKDDEGETILIPLKRE